MNDLRNKVPMEGKAILPPKSTGKVSAPKLGLYEPKAQVVKKVNGRVVTKFKKTVGRPYTDPNKESKANKIARHLNHIFRPTWPNRKRRLPRKCSSAITINNAPELFLRFLESYEPAALAQHVTVMDGLRRTLRCDNSLDFSKTDAVVPYNVDGQLHNAFAEKVLTEPKSRSLYKATAAQPVSR